MAAEFFSNSAEHSNTVTVAGLPGNLRLLAGGGGFGSVFLQEIGKITGEDFFKVVLTVEVVFVDYADKVHDQ